MRYIIFMLCIINIGCVSLATSVVTQTSMQIIGEQYLIATNKPIIRCNVFNVIQHNKTCRVYRQYKQHSNLNKI